MHLDSLKHTDADAGGGELGQLEASEQIEITVKDEFSNVCPHLHLCDLHIFIEFALRTLSSLCVFVSNIIERGRQKCGNSNEAACRILDWRHVVSLWAGWGCFQGGMGKESGGVWLSGSGGGGGVSTG